ncbi:MAG TPA: penicillin-insensitive murein endopeptidase [Polyangiaceae bacterium]|jgi:penicillin-insensitive murein endopeptidase|nr:penicillin-insensitive murein endopeptidase [Polyangiaceae bacterium]
MRRTLGLAVVGLALGGCLSTPSPLAPSFRGTVGAPNSGVQTDGVELPVAGPGFVRYRPLGAHHFGRPRLVAALTRIARELAESDPGAPPLVIGDLSGRFGGKIDGHQSHRTGRDVDLLYQYLTPGGARTTAPGFIHVEADGLARVPDDGQILRLDVEHEWRLVKALVTAPELSVQFMFASRNVEALLVDYALARGEPLDVVLRAQSVLWQPVDSLPHDDHIHLRIACSVEETLAGCTGGGPYWEWLPPLPAPVPLDDDRVAQLIADDPPLDPLPALLAPPGGMAAARAAEPSGGGPAVVGSVPSVVGE